MAESATSREIIRFLREQGAYAIKIHGEAMQTRTVDIFFCWRGLFGAIETKDGKGELSRLQEYDLRNIEKAGGLTVVAYSFDEFKLWFRRIEARAEHG